MQQPLSNQERGVSTVGYALMIALVLITAVTAVKGIGSSASGELEDAYAAMETPETLPFDESQEVGECTKGWSRISTDQTNRKQRRADKNADGMICRKYNRSGKEQVKDNNK